MHQHKHAQDSDPPTSPPPQGPPLSLSGGGGLETGPTRRTEPGQDTIRGILGSSRPIWEVGPLGHGVWLKGEESDGVKDRVPFFAPWHHPSSSVCPGPLRVALHPNGGLGSAGGLTTSLPHFPPRTPRGGAVHWGPGGRLIHRGGLGVPGAHGHRRRLPGVPRPDRAGR